MSPELRNSILDPINKNKNNYGVGIKSDIFSIGIIFLKVICDLKKKQKKALNIQDTSGNQEEKLFIAV